MHGGHVAQRIGQASGIAARLHAPIGAKPTAGVCLLWRAEREREVLAGARRGSARADPAAGRGAVRTAIWGSGRLDRVGCYRLRANSGGGCRTGSLGNRGIRIDPEFRTSVDGLGDLNASSARGVAHACRGSARR